MTSMMGALSFVPRPGLAVSLALACAVLAVPAASAATPELSVSQPWMRFLTPGMPAAGYFTLRNDGAQPMVLTAAASPDCGRLMLHESVVENGTAHMRMVQSVVVPAHGAIHFQPGGYHLMCMQPAATMAPGQTAAVSLRFKGGASLSADFPVYGPKGR